MKKVTLTVLAMLMLAGCSTNSGSIDTKISDDKTLVEVDGIKINKQDLFELFLDSNGANYVLSEGMLAIADSLITDTKEVEAKVEETVKEYASILGGEDKLNEYIKSMGYKDLEDYKATALLPSAKNTMLTQMYIDDNYEALLTEYGYSQIRYFTMDVESEAMTTIAKIDNGEMTFEDAANANGGKVPDTQLISTNYTSSNVDSNIIQMATSFTRKGMYSAPITLSSGKYAVIQVVNTDFSSDEFKETISSELLNVESFIIKVEAFYLKKYNFEVYEPTVKDAITEISGEYFSEE